MIPGLIGMPRHAFLPFFHAEGGRVQPRQGAGGIARRSVGGGLHDQQDDGVVCVCVIDNRVNENQ